MGKGAGARRGSLGSVGTAATAASAADTAVGSVDTDNTSPSKADRQKDKKKKRGLFGRGKDKGPYDDDEDDGVWMEFMDEGTGRPYYFNEKTKTTTWKKP